ncbi:MAG: N-acetyltransferase, partial [Desulfitobacteriaceae bacterium]
MFYCEEEFEEILQTVILVPYSPGYKLGVFDCEVEDYNQFLTNDAPYYIEQNISQIRLLIHKQTADVIAYMALNTDSFLLDKEEKIKENLDIPINSIPALKIGKLAVDYRYKNRPYGSFM